MSIQTPTALDRRALYWAYKNVLVLARNNGMQSIVVFLLQLII